MSRKDSSDGINNPFKALKGFSVAAAQAPPLPSPAPLRPAAGGEAVDFVAEMETLGVRKIAGDEVARCTASPPPPAPEEGTPDEAPSEAELFLKAVGTVQTVFADAWDDAEVSPPPTQRLKEVHRGRLKPQATLDLHGATRDEARRKVKNFIDNARHRDQRVLLIVTGWGKSGGGAAVLRDDLIRSLRHELATSVSEWGPAPRQLGGDGAVILILKRTRQG